jgi:hypothetical protein
LDIRGAAYILRHSHKADNNVTVINRAGNLVGSSWRTVGLEIQNAFTKVKHGKD